MSRDSILPFLINKDTEGHFRLTVRDTRYNSQGYPIVTSSLQDRAVQDGDRCADFRARELQGRSRAVRDEVGQAPDPGVSHPHKFESPSSRSALLMASAGRS